MRFVLSLLAWAAAAAAQAAALTDGSTGAVQSLSGRFNVPQSLGTVRGANLFHSFTRFGVLTGETATFSTSDAAIRNVISRVTGGEPSLIDGGIKLDAAAGSAPAFWLINPSGVVVGAGASFDVPGGLHLSTAPRLQMADGSTWDTGSSNGSSLSVAAPERFGFLGTQAAPLRWQGANLLLQPGATLELAAGSISIDQAVLGVPGGRIRVFSPGAVSLLGGARLEVAAMAREDQPALAIDAGQLLIDASSTAGTGLAVYNASIVAAGGGGLALTIGGAIDLLGAVEISSNNSSAVAAGPLRIQADSLNLDGGGQAGGIVSWALGNGAGAPMQIDLSGALRLSQGGQINSFTVAPGSAGDLRLNAGSVLIDDNHLQLGTGIRSQAGTGAGATGRIDVQTPGSLTLLSGASIFSNTRSREASGPVQVQAGNATLDGDGVGGTQIGSLSSGSTDAAAVQVSAADRLQLLPGGQISSGTFGSGAAGPVRVDATRIDLQGSTSAVTGVLNSALGDTSGPAGSVTVQATELNVRDGARVSSASVSSVGSAGDVSISVQRLLVDGGGFATGIDSFGYGLAGGAGRIQVQASESLSLLAGGSIVAGARGVGRPGEIDVHAGTLRIDGGTAQQYYTGIGGDALGDGTGAAVKVQATRIELRAGGQISSGTFSGADAGSVSVSADVLSAVGAGIDGSATGISTDSGGAGRAGSIAINAREMTLDRGALVSSSAVGSGEGGSIDIQTAQLRIANGAAIASVAADTGAAGRIGVQVSGAMTLESGGLLSANTGGRAAAGRIDVKAGSLTIGGSDSESGQSSRISSRARAESGGQPGNITIDVAGAIDLQPGALLSIANDATLVPAAQVQPVALTLRADSLHMQEADITAAASANAPAGAIALTTAGAMWLQDSSVRTSALDGDGGAIGLTAGGHVLLRDTRITTSVEGSRNGNGGDIRISSPALVLASGFVQANTTAPLARGGQVQVNAGLLLPDGNTVFVGGSRIETFRPGVPGYNVIQAAAPDGVSGQLSVTLPQLDLSAGLVNLSTRRLDLGVVARDVCEVGPDSRLSIQGRGALREPASAPLRLQP